MEIVTTRVLAFPVSAVFAAFRDPALLAQWWGPEGFTNTFSEFEFCVGGEWRFVMHGPDGQNYSNHSRFTEIVENESIVFDHLDEIHPFTMTMMFEHLEGETRLTWQMVNPSLDESLRSFISRANEQNFDRLEACLRANQFHSASHEEKE